MIRNFFKNLDNFKASVILTLLFAVACFAVYVFKNLTYSKDVILQKAGTYYINEQYFRAAKYYDKALELGATGADMLRNYGIALTKLANSDSALKYLKLSAESDPSNFETFYALGNAMFQKAVTANSMERFLQAAEYLEQAITLSPETEKSYILIGMCYRSCGMQEQARAWYRKALLSGNFSQAGFYNLLGHTFREEERFAEAASYYNRAAGADYSFVAAYCNMGDMYVKLNDNESALVNYKKAIEINPDYMIPYVRIGSLYADAGSFDEAIPWYQRALKINPDSDRANYLLGIAYKEIGRKKDAVELLKKAAYGGSDDAVYELKNMGVELR
jgi:tetratricopeptide (TPR) repeat protein